ncbi:hypothetical protein D6C77_09845 [Aureobasidium pullulans]|uniref:Uncharacterized protein n=1 Tax=Aureobasidium pullulans TaxID=5580 RepID=A0A4T0CPR2_AURPU|nr:hypothetical protein D6C90_04559 [Aureobasidium pullulans]TIA48645.1 hypothetical protein D6C77_09845 [Aureobasidium pullulans]
MPTLPRPGKQSLFDMVEQNKATAAQAQADENATSQQDQTQYTTSQKQLDPEISSIFTQSTIDTGNPIHQSTSSSSSRFGFLRRNKSSSNPQDQAGLLANSAGGEGVKEKEKKKSRFENPFKPHEQTDEDRAIMEKLAKRLGKL